MQSGTLEIDLHGMTKVQAKAALDAALRRAGGSVYRVAVVHGCHGGTALRDFLQETYATHPKVRRLVLSPDGGATELVLREY